MTALDAFLAGPATGKGAKAVATQAEAEQAEAASNGSDEEATK
jgi:hypothetical protein